jgi:hypothetical protein
VERELKADEHEEEDRKRFVLCLYILFGELLAFCLLFLQGCHPPTFCRILALYKSKRNEEEIARGRTQNQVQEDKV